jgi:hypothetical protein
MATLRGMIKPALLPLELIRREPRKLHNILPGESVYIPLVHFAVKEDRTCFVDLEAELCDKRRSTVRVTKGPDGNFSVEIASDLTFKPGESLLLAKSRDMERLAPVSSITVVQADPD